MRATATLLILGLSACGLTPLPEEPPPLKDMEEPIALKKEPDDEARREKLALGSFTGIHVKSAWFEEPDEPGQKPEALAIEKIVENSPAAAADLREGDLLIAARVGDGGEQKLSWPSQWRKLETDHAAGTVLRLVFDRAGVEKTANLTLVARVRPPSRVAAESFREERHAGIVLRTATEVESRAAGLGPGGGAVLIGMAANSPWRAAGLQFGDLIVKVQEQPLDHPQLLLGAIRTAAPDFDLTIDYRRGTTLHTVSIPLTSRESDITEVSLFGLFSYTDSRDTTELSILLGLVGFESTPAAWEFRLLWLFCIKGGDSDILQELKR